jgi:hypothetical protein
MGHQQQASPSSTNLRITIPDHNQFEQDIAFTRDGRQEISEFSYTRYQNNGIGSTPEGHSGYSVQADGTQSSYSGQLTAQASLRHRLDQQMANQTAARKQREYEAATATEGFWYDGVTRLNKVM